MSTEDDFEYFTARSLAEQAASEAAADEKSREIHAALAAEYEERAGRLKKPRSTLHIVSPCSSNESSARTDKAF